jgi:hypothetical protein
MNKEEVTILIYNDIDNNYVRETTGFQKNEHDSIYMYYY